MERSSQTRQSKLNTSCRRDSTVSNFKLWEDNQEKRFLKLALTSLLVPSNSNYNLFYRDFDIQAAARGYKVDDYPCHHSPEGLTCFFTNSYGSKHGTLVLNKADVATVYASLIGGVSNDATIKDIFNNQYTPSIKNEEFLDKIGILGKAYAFASGEINML